MSDLEAARRPTPRIALVIPALNEEAVIAGTLKRVPVGLFDLIMVADNGSGDTTAAIARGCGAAVVTEPRRGYGAACLRALSELPEDTEIVVFMQADGSEDPAEANKLLLPLLEGRADLVLGSRTLGRAEPGSLLPHQIFGNWLATALIRWIFGYSYTDLGPFRAIRMKALRGLSMRDQNYGWTIEMQVRAIQCGLRIVEVPVSYMKRAAGVNKVSGNWRASFRAGITIISTVLKLGLFGRGVTRAVKA